MRNRILVNIKGICKVYLKILSGIFSVIGVVGLFYNFQDNFDSFYETVFGLIVICILAVPCAIVEELCRSKTEISLHNGNKKLIVEFGNIFQIQCPIKVIPVNRCFDIEVDGKLISKKSLHGQWIEKYLEHHSKEELEKAITTTLASVRGKKLKEKRAGRKMRYPVGTVVPIKDGDTLYYLLGLTTLDSHTLKASCDIMDYCKAILVLFQYYNTYGQQADIVVPLVGSGLARLGRCEYDILNCMLALIRMGFNFGQGNIRIVLHDSLREKIALSTVKGETIQ